MSHCFLSWNPSIITSALLPAHVREQRKIEHGMYAYSTVHTSRPGGRFAQGCCILDFLKTPERCLPIFVGEPSNNNMPKVE